MALRTLMLRRSISRKQAELAALRARITEFKTREAELEAAINEAETEEQEQAVREEVEQFEADRDAHNSAVSALEGEISQLESDLADEEAKQPKPAAPAAAPNNRKDGNTMANRSKFFGMSVQERDAFVGGENVQKFLQRVRTLGGQNRAVTGADLLIPTEVMDLIRENVGQHSKLYTHVRVRKLKGKARQPVMGTVPEGIWMEMVGALNELDIGFGAVEADGYKVGGFIVIANSTLEDSDINLAYELITALLQAIGIGLDKAILYGTGTKMPMGILTRLAQTADPENDKVNVPWKNLSASNIVAITGKTGIALYQEVIKATGNAKGKRSSGAKFWAMSDTTKTTLLAEALTFNAAGAITAGIGNTMPVIGGEIETLDFIPDGVIIGGFGDQYLLVERAGGAVKQSEHRFIIEDQTVFVGTARYDGVPVIAEGFVAIGISGTKPAANAVTFTEDKANAAAAAAEDGE
jgi:HK97 family phage major capsid protein